MSHSAFTAAQGLLAGAGTWHEFKTSLLERRLDLELSPADMDALRDQWQARNAAQLSDQYLAEEITFWSKGGTFDQHLDGYQAIGPGALLTEAERRGWFVRRLSSGALVNAPDGKPLMLRGLDVVARS